MKNATTAGSSQSNISRLYILKRQNLDNKNNFITKHNKCKLTNQQLQKTTVNEQRAAI